MSTSLEIKEAHGSLDSDEILGDQLTESNAYREASIMISKVSKSFIKTNAVSLHEYIIPAFQPTENTSLLEFLHLGFP